MNRYVTRKAIASSIVFIATVFGAVWAFGPTQNVPAPAEASLVEPVAVSPDRSQRQELEQFADLLRDKDVSYNGYTMKRFTQTIRDKITDRQIEVTYAALMKGDRRLLKFDGVYFIEGNSTEFELLDLLGNDSRQFVVSQTVPRGGRHWVVSVSPPGASGTRARRRRLCRGRSQFEIRRRRSLILAQGCFNPGG